MAFNQASFILFAPGFGPSVEFDHSTKTASGKPLAIVSACTVDASASTVVTNTLRQWFIDRGFTEKERYGGCQVIFRGRETTSLGTQEVVELALPFEEDAVQELYIRFLLTERTPEQVADWRELIAELGHDFGFQIMDESHGLLPCVDFPTLLAQNWNYCAFQKNYGWKV
jgi:hypothetical protein